MAARPPLARCLRLLPESLRVRSTRLLTTSSGPAAQSEQPENTPRRPKSWLTRKLEKSPAAKSAFLKMANIMGYGSPKQVAGRRAFAMYEQLCVVRPDEDMAFWQEGTSVCSHGCFISLPARSEVSGCNTLTRREQNATFHPHFNHGSPL